MSRSKPSQPGVSWAAQQHCATCCLGSRNRRSKTGQRNKGIRIRKDETALSLFWEDVIVHIQNLKEDTNELLE